MADPTHPVKLYTVPQFNQRASELFAEDDATPFIQFVLTGILDGEQASINVIPNRITEDIQHSLCMSRDMDSLLGMSRHIRCHSDFTVFPIPNYDDTLKKNVHINFQGWDDLEGTRVPIPLHHIPNFGLGRWRGTNTLVRVFFPDLCSPTRRTYHVLKEEEIKFVNQGLIPTMRELLDLRGGNVPIDHRAEMFRARQTTGRLAFGTNILPEWKVTSFGDTLRQTLLRNGVEWGANIFFLHQVRGVKNATYHAANDFDGALAASRQFVADWALDWDELVQDSGWEESVGGWWIDVGLEVVSNANSTLCPETSAHRSLTELALGLEREKAARITKLSSSGYYRDPASHLTGASGFRLIPPRRARGEYEAAYMQVYLTDKSQTYAPEGSKFGKAISASQLLRGKGEGFISELYRIYNKAGEDVISAVRIEVRVPFKYAPSVLLDLDNDLLSKTFLSFPSADWWALKAWRCLALKIVNEWQYEGMPIDRSRESALHLTAMTAWMVNSIHSTPDLGPSSRELLEVTLPRVRRDHAVRSNLLYPIKIVNPEEEEESGSDDSMASVYGSESGGRQSTPAIHNGIQRARGNVGIAEPTSLARGTDLVPHAPYGIIFLRQFRNKVPPPPIPRFEDKRFFLSDKSFKFLFNQTREQLILDLEGSRIVKPSNPSRLRNKVRQPIRPAPTPENFVGFNLEQEGMALDPIPHDDGSDLSEGEWVVPEVEVPRLDTEVEKLWNQFLFDMINTSPNRKNAKDDPYCLMKKEELDAVDISIYQNLYLGEIFDDVQWCVGTKKEWRAVFDNLFPAKGVEKVGKLQNYHKTVYYPMWTLLTSSRMDAVVAEATRTALWKVFKTLKWAPFAESMRIWGTRSDRGGFSKNSGRPAKEAAPRIIVRRTPDWVSLLDITIIAL
ncbi:hypothetical protein FA15DRAFT_734940 [Coprinopsis marcescibilis]|uniref:Uncharacterized protein n=1 Tax=Coprinopsis marcescibilis TaxID=230819 RepID=A0A5C3KC05_COPMA|nr:hypothetical protein FA15DRAFT_734940 [Coprinopsis marcescibilis]